MKIPLPPDTPQNLVTSFNESQRILGEAFIEAQTSANKYEKEMKIRKWIAYSLKGATVICTILITAGYIPHQLALIVVLLYGADTVLTNGKRLVSIVQASKAYTKAEKKVSRTHQVELTEILRVENNMNKVNKLIDLNKNLTKDIYDTFTTIEAAVDKSDIELLQALSLDEDKLNIAKKHL